jgi:hypothetical protein
MGTNGCYFPPRPLTRPLLSITRDVDPAYDRDANKLRILEFSSGRVFTDKPSNRSGRRSPGSR